jgi:hypothetical protein
MEKQFNITKEQYLTMLTTWRATKAHDAADQILYNILRTKPADRGFIAKSKHIQGNDPWFAYHNALFLARRRISLANPYPMRESSQSAIDARKAAFKQTFGFDIPEGIADKLEGAKK